ncbi:MAG: hypothetical protein A2X49_05920 [Lentisphaerae bacterium GWF2_52_8]|nr:MAG: hypothetical protein A2X49_05920 [Lentisphaerae bacterium GWF2_52_8]
MTTVLKQFITNPRTTGALWASSSHLSRTMTLNIGIESAKVVVELGPGTGAITEHILPAISPNTCFFAVELNKEMLKVFENRFPETPIYHDSASNLPSLLDKKGVPAADVVISGLPWAAFPSGLQDEILDAILASLAKKGFFTTFAYLQGLLLPSAQKFSKKLKRHFSRVEKSPVVWRNIPPAFVYRCQK